MSQRENEPEAKETKTKFTLMGGQKDNLAKYSFFNKQDPIAWHYYCVQQCAMWMASEIPYVKDKETFRKLPERHRRLFEEILGFFAPGDGLVSAVIIRQLQEATNFMEVGFLLFQAANESVHAETYGLFIKTFARDPAEEKRIFNMVENIPCVKAKADFIVGYVESDIPRCLRNLAQACAEGIFFVALFSIIFYFRHYNIMEAFIFANEQISKDETTHRDYYCAKAEEYGINKYPAEAKEIIIKAVNIEIAFVRYLLREPIDSVMLDEANGITIDNLTQYIYLLADQILVNCGLEIMYSAHPNLSWMRDLGLQKKTNFYEKKVGNYKKGSLDDQLDWKKKVGMVESETLTNSVENPDEVDF